MTNRRLVWRLRMTAALGGLLGAGGSLHSLRTGSAHLWWGSGGSSALVFALVSGAVVWLVGPRQSRNAVIWVTAAACVLSGAYLAGLASTRALVEAGTLFSDPMAPSGLRSGAGWLMAITRVSWVPAILVQMTLGLLLFPDGRLPSRRWRPVAFFSVAVVLVATSSNLWHQQAASTALFWFDWPRDGLSLVVGLGASSAFALALVGFVVRFRRSRGGTHQQFKWLVWGGSVSVPALALGLVLRDGRDSAMPELLLALAVGAFLGSYALALAEYRLDSVEMVMSRTLVYAALAVLITGVYLAVVMGAGGWIGLGAGSSPLLAIAATALIAFLFEPARRRLQRGANRLVHGRRATPYEVLSQFARNVATSDEALLTQVATSVADGTTADRAEVWVATDGALTRAAAWPPCVDSDWMETADSFARLEAAGPVWRVTHDGETLGALALSTHRRRPLLPSDERLVDQVAAGLGLVLRDFRLDQDLKRQLEELRRSAQRIVAAQDETRRRVERDLHDGAQQRLVAIRIKLGAARTHVDAGSSTTELAACLDGVAAETDAAIAALRDVAGGIYPAVLQRDGVAAALKFHLRTVPLLVTVHAPGVGRHPPPVEAAIYFCVLEALQNVVQHAEASSAHIGLREADGWMTFEVSDDGKGFDPEVVHRKSGLIRLVDRVDALGGSLELVSIPGKGTSIRGQIPSPAMIPAS